MIPTLSRAGMELNSSTTTNHSRRCRLESLVNGQELTRKFSSSKPNFEATVVVVTIPRVESNICSPKQGQVRITFFEANRMIKNYIFAPRLKLNSEDGLQTCFDETSPKTSSVSSKGEPIILMSISRI